MIALELADAKGGRAQHAAVAGGKIHTSGIMSSYRTRCGNGEVVQIPSCRHGELWHDGDYSSVSLSE